jgi:nitrite reductase/ring-hydroxylating ferredoxin subunit
VRFLALEKLINLHDGYRKVVKHNALEVLLMQEEGCLHIVHARCPHQEQSLQSAEVVGNHLYCPRHQYGFDLSTGWQIDGACGPLKVYAPIFEGALIGIELPDEQ